jgi:hypothetical protein
VTVIQDLIETAAVEIAGARHRRLGSHGKTPVLSGSLPRNRYFTMLREDEESFSLNKLWIVQGRLVIGKQWICCTAPPSGRGSRALIWWSLCRPVMWMVQEPWWPGAWLQLLRD